MRIDKFFTTVGLLTRSQCAKAAKAGMISVNGKTVRDPAYQTDPARDAVFYRGERIIYSEFVYIVMNKPLGCVCSNDEPGERIVFDLLGDAKRSDLFTVGRLDKETSGLIIITNDGKTAHTVLSPKHHVKKTYAYGLADPLSEEDRRTVESGVELRDGYTTMPCEITPANDRSGTITICEGKYHQIRRMFASVSNRVTSLCRVSFGDITLDPSLSPGEWRYMTDSEIASFGS